MTDKYLTITEVAEILGIHRRTAWNWVRAGKLKAITIPGRGTSRQEYRIKESDLEAFLNGGGKDD